MQIQEVVMSAVLEKDAQPKTATLASLRAPQAPETQLPAVRMGFTDLQGFELMQRAGKALGASTLVPKEYQGNLPNCLIALEMAQRIGASPLQVMQNLYVVHGRPAWSAKFLIASFNQCGRFSAVRYEWSGKRGSDDWSCKAWAVEKATGEKIEGPTISIALAKKEGWYEKNGSKWKTIPELMLMYRSAAWLVNTHAPEISMGLNTAEEIHDVYDATPGSDGHYQVTTGELQQQPQPQEQRPAGNAEDDTETLLDKVRRICADAQSMQDRDTAFIRLDDARVLIPEMLPENADEADRLIKAAEDTIRARG
jgi:hypothetical protein